MGVGVVDAGRRDLVELLAVPGDRVGQVDDVEDLGAAEAGALHSSSEVSIGAAPGTVMFGPGEGCSTDRAKGSILASVENMCGGAVGAAAPRPAEGPAVDPIAVEPVDEVVLTTLVDNTFDGLLTGSARVRRTPLTGGGVVA